MSAPAAAGVRACHPDTCGWPEGVAPTRARPGDLSERTDLPDPPDFLDDSAAGVQESHRSCGDGCNGCVEREFARRAMDAMKAVQRAAEAGYAPDIAMVPAHHWREFVDAHAALMHARRHLQARCVLSSIGAALAELYRVCLAMDADRDAERPTEAAYQVAMEAARAALGVSMPAAQASDGPR